MMRIIALLLILTPTWTVADDLKGDIVKAKGGDFDAMLRVGLAYLSDKDADNNADGIKWLEMSSAGGNVKAYYNLGALYQEGGMVKKDPNKAIMYLTIAAELGEIRAMNRLAGIYFVGKLAPTNDVLAVKWALCAAGLGSETAKRNLEKVRGQVSKRSAYLGSKAAEAWTKKRFGEKQYGEKPTENNRPKKNSPKKNRPEIKKNQEKD